MILFPAVDIKDGQCVRLKQGKKDEVTIFSSDPVAQAVFWVNQGAQYLHVVDLDGAFEGVPKNFDLIRNICDQSQAPVQLGGGIRDIASAQAYLDAGVERLIIGTMALEDEKGFGELCKALPQGRVGVSLDADNGRLKTKGWVADAGYTVDDVLPRLIDQGAGFIIYTDISRDGMESGVNLPALESLLGKTSLPVIIAGGVTNLDDIKQLLPYESKGLSGIISGRAIYSGSLDFKAALELMVR